MGYRSLIDNNLTNIISHVNYYFIHKRKNFGPVGYRSLIIYIIYILILINEFNCHYSNTLVFVSSGSPKRFLQEKILTNRLCRFTIFKEFIVQEDEAMIRACAGEIYDKACQIVEFPDLAKDKQEYEFSKRLVEIVSLELNNKKHRFKKYRFKNY